MKISVIIPTYNGAHKILNVLRSLEKQILKPFEVIVVIDGSTDGTFLLLQNQIFNFSQFRIIEQKNGGRAHVRNSGASQAQGELLIFFDDDMRPLDDCVQKHCEFHKNHLDAILTGGIKEEITSDSNEMLRFKSYLSDKWNVPLLKVKDSPLPQKSLFLAAANFSISKQNFELLGGFDERLSDAEDYDLAVRAFNAGLNLYFKNDAFAWHDDSITCATYVQRQRQYTNAQKILAKLSPEIHKNNGQYAVKLPTGIKAILFRGLCSNWWIGSIEKRSWSWLPKPIRYKLYDLIITANGSMYPEKVKLGGL